jgi:Protein of unknown function (DUF5818)
MRKITLALFVAFALCMATAVAQTQPSGSQRTQSAPGQPGTMQQPGTEQPGGTPGMGQDQSNNPNQNKAEKSEKKLKGCVQSQGGQYVLETKKGKAVNLAGQDVSAHVGHEVAVKGTYESGGAGMSSASSSGNASGSEKTFNVSSVDMISDTCKSSKGSSGSMGASPSGSNPSGTGSGAGTGTGTGTQPPQ